MWRHFGLTAPYRVCILEARYQEPIRNDLILHPLLRSQNEPIIKSEPKLSASMALQPLSGLATVMTKQNEKRIIFISLRRH